MPEIRKFTASDGYEWKWRRYEPLGTPVGEVIGLHGIQSHGGWYTQTSDWLAGHGWGVSFLDRRGSGLNGPDRGDCPSFRRLLDDIAQFTLERSRPLVVLAISWGAKLAVALQKRHPGVCDGLILIAPGFCPRVRPGFATRMRILGARLSNPRRTFPIPLNDPELFTDNPDRVRFIANDPHALHEATARLLVESTRLDLYLRLARQALSVPVLLLLAGEDRIIDNGRTRRFLPSAAVVEYPRAHHTLEFEAAGPPYYEDLAKWLRLRLGAKPQAAR